MRIKNVSFKTKILLLVEVFFVASGLFVGTIFWQELSLKVREISRLRLMAIASTAAAMTDVYSHNFIQTQEDEDTDNYIAIQSVYKKILAANDGVDDIYTLRTTDDENTWIFVVGTLDTADRNGNGKIETEEERVAVGEEFDVSELPEIKKALSEPAADHEINCDKWGCWLSGYAPLVDKYGNTAAILGVDISADDILAYEKKMKILIGSLFISLILLLPIMLYLFMRVLLRPISEIVKGLNSFSQDLSSRIHIETGDEFEAIASTFNMMAMELERSYKGMEETVREKTKALAAKIEEIELEKVKDEALLASIGEGMIAVDSKGKIMMMNLQAGKLLGLEVSKAAGVFLEELIQIEDEQGNMIGKEKRPVYLSLLTGQKMVSSSFYYVRSDGYKFPVFLTAAPVKLKNKIIGSIVIFRDITEEKRIDVAKSNFVSLASHQLRTPLASISWYSEMLLDGEAGELREKQKKYLEKIVESQTKMEELVKELLNVSRIEMGTFIIDPKPISFSDIMEDVLGEFYLQLMEKKIKLAKKFPSRLPKIPADSQLVRIVFENLISNAIKYTPDEGTIEVEVSVSKKESLISARVSDSGYGIPKKQQHRIFTKLFRADNIIEKDVDGTGLGLYLVKSIVDNSGGSIEFSSEENKGSTFVVRYPLSGMKEKHGSKKLV